MIGTTDIRFIGRSDVGGLSRDLATFVRLEYGERSAEWFVADGRSRERSGRAREDGSRRGHRSIAALAVSLLLRFRGRSREAARRTR